MNMAYKKSAIMFTNMKVKKPVKKRKINSEAKIYDLIDILEYVEKNMKPHPRLNMVKWMAKHGR
jgi:hypothetical protein